MERKINAIPVKELAKVINVHKNTLFAWMCHYSLAKYNYQIYTEKGTVENMFKLNKDSLSAFRNYLSRKRIKYLTYLEARMDEIKKYYA